MARTSPETVSNKYCYSPFMQNFSVKHTDFKKTISKSIFLLFLRRRIDDLDLPVICRFLHNNPNVVSVNLAYNHITDKGMTHIIRFLEVSHILTITGLVFFNIYNLNISLSSNIFYS